MARIKELQVGNDKIVGEQEWELLWENANPNAEFAGQTLSLDLSKYQEIMIQTSWYAVGNGGYHIITREMFGVQFPLNDFSSTAKFRRSVTVNNTGIAFTGGYRCNFNSSSESDNAYGVCLNWIKARK